MMNDWCQPLSSDSGASLGPHTLHSSVSLGLAVDTMGWGHWGLNQSQPPPIPALWDLNQSGFKLLQPTGEMLLTRPDISTRENFQMKCLTCLGTGRIHSIQALCIRWCHCKLRQNLQQMRKNQNHRSQSGEQLLSKCLSPGKVTSKREQNLTQRALDKKSLYQASIQTVSCFSKMLI